MTTAAGAGGFESVSNAWSVWGENAFGQGSNGNRQQREIECRELPERNTASIVKQRFLGCQLVEGTARIDKFEA